MKNIATAKIYSKVKRYFENFSDYFHDYEKSSILQMKYFWDILATLKREFVKKCIDHLIKDRNKQKLAIKDKIETSEKIMNQINWMHFDSKQK